MDSNRSRSKRYSMVLYLADPDAKQLNEVAEYLGENKNAVLRMALREYLAKMLLEMRARKRAAVARTADAPCRDRVEAIRCLWHVGRNIDIDDISAWVRARLQREYPRARLKLNLYSGPIKPHGTCTPDGPLNAKEKETVTGYLEELVAEVVEEFTVTTQPKR